MTMRAPHRVPWKGGLLQRPVLTHMLVQPFSCHGNACLKVSQKQQPAPQVRRKVTLFPSGLQGLVTKTDTGTMRRTSRETDLQRMKQVEVEDGAASPAQRILTPAGCEAGPHCPWLLPTRLVIWQVHSGAFCLPLILQTRH